MHKGKRMLDSDYKETASVCVWVCTCVGTCTTVWRTLGAHGRPLADIRRWGVSVGGGATLTRLIGRLGSTTGWRVAGVPQELDH